MILCQKEKQTPQGNYMKCSTLTQYSFSFVAYSKGKKSKSFSLSLITKHPWVWIMAMIGH